MTEFETESVLIVNRQEIYSFGEDLLERFAHAVEKARSELVNEVPDSLLSGLDQVEFSIIDDAKIARVHDEFFHDPTATDVITFEHGEILVSAETAQRQAEAYSSNQASELVLYMIHGLAHLSGYDDRNESDQKRMNARQEELLGLVWRF